jgi:hypothetical protein
MANTLANSTWVTKEVARGYVNNLQFVRNINRTYSDQYVQNGAKYGNVVNVRMPQRFVVTEGQAIQLQNLSDVTVPVPLTKQLNVAFGWSSAQATTELDDVRRRYVDPAAAAIANKVDTFMFDLTYRDVYNAVGTYGTTPSAALTLLQAGVKLSDLGAPQDGRIAMLDYLASATIANGAATLFNPAAVISDNYEKGLLGRNQLGYSKFFGTQNCPVHTTGTFTASTPLVNSASQTGSSLITNGWASDATSLKKGDIFTVAGVYSVNYPSFQSTGRLQQFVVTADCDDTSGDMTIGISPSIITSGAYQTVSNSPAHQAVITVMGATSATAGTLATTVSKQSLLYHPDFAAFVTADLDRPTAGCSSSIVSSKQAGISIRMIEQYQIASDQNPSRLDVFVGGAPLDPSKACRMVG